jgi:DNA-binding CsgD family transcriptional regulator
VITTNPAQPLLGRQRESGVLDRLLSATRNGRGSLLVLRGEPGVGKTALLERAIESAHGFRVVRASGVESEMELPFAALQQLSAPLLDGIGQLPAPQRAALTVAFGLSAGEAPDRLLVGLAMLSLLSNAAEEQPLLVVVDDAQWLDRASATVLAFVARRLLAERVAMVFGAREPAKELLWLPELAVAGLGKRDARALLESALRVSLDEQVRERIVAETHGNPLALLELPRVLTRAEVAGGFGWPAALPLSERIEECFRRQLAELPSDTRQLLLVAAAEPVGDPLLVWRAAGQLGISASAADAANASGLLEIGVSVTFRYPLARSAVYRAAPADDRRSAHCALAEATDPELDPDRRAWHLAQATPGPDEAVAAELERSAGRAQSRGGMAAAAAFLERAATLTDEPSQRARRALAAAQAKNQSGELEAALVLLATAESGPLNEFQRAEAEVLRAEIAFASSRGNDVPPLLLQAARRLERLDPLQARETYLDALAAALFAGRLATGGGTREIAEAARLAPAAPQSPRAVDLLLDGLVALIIDGDGVAAPTLQRAVNAFRGDGISKEQGIRWLWVAAHAAGLVWDYEGWDALSSRLVQLIRETGAIWVLPIVLSMRAGVRLMAGELGVAEVIVEEVQAYSEVTASTIAPYASLALVVYRGHHAEALEQFEIGTKEVLARGEGEGLTFIQWITAVLNNSLGHYEIAVEAAEQASETSPEVWFSTWGLVELIEAGTRTGQTERAAQALERLTETTQASGTDWAIGIEARSRALLSEGEAAETDYRQAIDALGRTRVRVELARAHLLYGEWLRRERRRIDARRELQTAHRLFTDFGMEAFAERARVELEATGAHARKRLVATREELTPQEAQVSRLAADGATNHEIAAQLFISASTVEYHLSKAYRKLGVRSRTQLARYVGQLGPVPELASRPV